jgi:hypothetical protein
MELLSVCLITQGIRRCLNTIMSELILVIAFGDEALLLTLGQQGNEVFFSTSGQRYETRQIKVVADTGSQREHLLDRLG